ncbi:hypothetical protein [Asaia krungthepensis]|uniref:DsrE family protein n=1 Tax=Asaia krungthepensis NRIC 0535 TaxID=1307925 RepID=A0ABQ0PW85_9PROT|nr:hypothetical protein [Asaia krungthepensis]GBQ83166.1 hypothetical protein AA0535_0177 [Asaia krungthepensis NRIC 0535]
MMAIVLADRSFERAHHAFVLAAGALALGREVVLFAGGLSVEALRLDWSGLDGACLDEQFQERGVAGFETLRSAVLELAGEVLACEAGMRAAGIGKADLLEGVRICGVTSFLECTADAQIISL